MSKFCPDCGAETNGAKFCPSCGKQLQETPPNPGTSSEQQNYPHPPSAPPLKKRHGCLIPIIIFLLIGMGLAIAVSKSATELAQSSPAVSLSPEEMKQAAGDFDQTVWDAVYVMIKANNSLMESITAYSEGRVSDVDLYDYCNDLADSLGKQTFAKSSNENEEAYVSSCTTFQLYLQTTARSAANYINKPTTENLSKLKEDIENSKQASEIVLSNRVVFLKVSGFSAEEIKEIASTIED